jgi:tight adherence protein C
MTFLLFAIGLILVGVSGRLLARAIVAPRLHLKAHLQEIADYGFEPQVAAVDLAFRERFRRLTRATARRVGRFVMGHFPGLKPLSSGELAAAGIYDVTDEVVHGYRVMAAVALPTLLLLLFAATGKLSALDILLVLLSIAAGFVLPSAVIRRRGAARLDEVDRQLPEMIDLLIAMIEAGIGFTAALGMVAERFQGSLGDEMRLTMKQQSLGMSTQQALEDMAARCATISVRAFVRTASRGETLGVSIGPVLRELSSDQRRRRRQAAREKMQKAPIKMIFPLMFLIMPALMIVLMYPAVYGLVKSLPSGF